MSHLVFDIETSGEDFEAMDPLTQDALTHWVEKNDTKKLQEIKEKTGLSPLTGEIVTIGVYDLEKKKGVVYFQCPDKKIEPFTEDAIDYKPSTEKSMLEQFWQGATRYSTFVSFNGRMFDAPFLIIRSAINEIKPTVDLMSNRYLNKQWNGVRHIDLFDQLTFYGASSSKGSLHMWTRAFSIKSPKQNGMSGKDIHSYFRQKKYKEIARYNAQDLFATAKLFEYWKNFIG